MRTVLPHDAGVATVALLEPASRELVVRAADGRHAEGLAGIRVPIDDSLAGEVFRSGSSAV